MTTSTYKFNADDLAPFNNKAVHSDGELCYVCGRKLGANPLYFEVHEGGYLRLQDGTEAIRDGGYMGHYAVGSECAKKFAPNLLKKLGA